VSAPTERLARETTCTRCGARLAADQDWCLECGAAVRTRILPAPDWRVPLAIVGAVIALAAAALVLALISLSNSANRSDTPAVTSAPAAAIISSSDDSSMRPGDFIVFSGTYATRTRAEAAASALHAQGRTGAYAFSVFPAS
jgi:hypothetical protein